MSHSKVLTRQLTQRGFRVETAINGLLALNALRIPASDADEPVDSTHHFEAVLMDIECARRARSRLTSIGCPSWTASSRSSGCARSRRAMALHDSGCPSSPALATRGKSRSTSVSLRASMPSSCVGAVSAGLTGSGQAVSGRPARRRAHGGAAATKPDMTGACLLAPSPSPARADFADVRAEPIGAMSRQHPCSGADNALSSNAWRAPRLRH